MIPATIASPAPTVLLTLMSGGRAMTRAVLVTKLAPSLLIETVTSSPPSDKVFGGVDDFGLRLERFADESFQLMNIGLDDIRSSFDRMTESFATGVEDDLAAPCFKRHNDVPINCGIHAWREAGTTNRVPSNVASRSRRASRSSGAGAGPGKLISIVWCRAGSVILIPTRVRPAIRTKQSSMFFSREERFKGAVTQDLGVNSIHSKCFFCLAGLGYALPSEPSI